MSEIKGQLLGIILVLVIFGAVATTMGMVFTNSLNKVNSKYNETVQIAESQVSTSAGAAAAAPAGLYHY